MSHYFVRRTPVDVLEVDGESLVLLDDAHVVRLSPIATAVFGLTATARTVAGLAVALEEAFGPPGDGATLDAASAVVAELVAVGALEEVSND